MKLTIVLTVYNKDQYLHRAVDSILAQTGVQDVDYEVLVVNDGSTDGSSKILEDYARKNKRVRILYQQNQGLSMARNNGVANALGEYVWFVDADDTISSNAVSLICAAIEKKPDLIPIYAKTKGVEKVRNKVPKNVQTGKDILLCKQWETCGVFNVFRKEFLTEKELSFYPGIYHEDTEFTPRALYYAKKVVVVPEVLYHVYKTEGSITNVPKPKRAYDCLFVADSNNKIIDDNNERGSKVGRALCERVACTITSSLNIILKNDRKEWGAFNDALYEKKNLFRTMEQAYSFRYRFLAKTFRIFPRKYVQIYKMLKII